MRIVFMGTPEFAVPVLESLLIDHYEVAAVYTQPDAVSGRGRSLAASPVKRLALEWGLPVVQPSTLKEAEAVARLVAFQPEVIVVAAFGQILPQSVLDIPPHGCVNIHPSLLPKHRGASPVAASILAGDEFTGTSVMLMDRGMDTGTVLAQARIPILAQDTTGSLAAKLALVSASLLLDVLPRWMKKEISPRQQNEAEATYTKVFTKEDGEIDWRLPAVELGRRVRAFSPWPGTYTRWQGKQLKIIEAAPVPGEKTAETGRVVALDKGGVAVGVTTGDGILGLKQLQLEGKRALSAAEFIRGQRQFIGAVLPS
ncbi:MAG: methionyl-tRNA formyltransferase [Chloroflexota bacterium]